MNRASSSSGFFARQYLILNDGSETLWVMGRSDIWGPASPHHSDGTSWVWPQGPIRCKYIFYLPTLEPNKLSSQPLLKFSLGAGVWTPQDAWIMERHKANFCESGKNTPVVWWRKTVGSPFQKGHKRLGDRATEEFGQSPGHMFREMSLREVQWQHGADDCGG